MNNAPAAPVLRPLPPMHPAAAQQPERVGSAGPDPEGAAAPAKHKPAPKAAPATTTKVPKSTKAAKPAKAAKAGTVKKPAAGGAKASAAKKPAASTDAPPAAKAKRQEVDVDVLPEGEAKKRVSAIYKLERVVERKQLAYDTASRHRRAAKAELEEAQEALKHELDEQRFGPGPLFNPTGTGPAKVAEPAAS